MVQPEMVEELFARPQIVKGGGEGEGKPKEPKVVSLLDQKVSLNVNIFLKQFKR